jgi:hypothetical protein
MSLSVLQAAGKSDIRLSPYPHIIIRDALPAALCEQLIAEYPALDVLGVDPTRNNVRWSVPGKQVLENPAIPGAWRDVIGYHASRAFYDEFLDLFAASIMQLYPGLYPEERALRELRAGVREIDDFKHADILLDAQISGSTPVTRARSVKPNHIDSHRKLFTGLLYLRRDDDDSTGGDLEIRRFRKVCSGKRRAGCYDGVYVDDRHTERVATVPYAKNVLILFINSLESLHGVSVRQVTPHCRLFMNIVGEVNTPLFAVPRTFATRMKKLHRQVRKRAIRLAGGEYTEPYRDGY